MAAQDKKVTQVVFENTLYVDPMKTYGAHSDDDRVWETSIDPLVNVFSCGWMEDGRLGYSPHEPCYRMPDGNPSYIQHSPRPVEALRDKWEPNKHTKKHFVCKMASAGTRHSLFLMVNVAKENDGLRKTRRVLISGLNQLGLCEDPGFMHPTVVPWDNGEPPVRVYAGHGTSFIISKYGNIFSFGQDKFGVLGHGEADMPMRVPRQILSLKRRKIVSVAVGNFHVCCIDDDKKAYSWGRNNQGQCGRGFVSPCILEPGTMDEFNQDQYPLMISCGQEHCLALVRITRKDGEVIFRVYNWGDGSRGQLGSGKPHNAALPHENRELARMVEKNLLGDVTAVAAGGYHNVILTSNMGNVITYGAGDYGQLGNGWQWDDPKPRIVPRVNLVFHISAGWRHTIVIRRGDDGISQVCGWGYNGYGELGIGDSQIRTVPTMITAFKRSRIRSVSCGPRHTLFVAYHKPLLAREEPMLRQYFAVLEEGITKFMMRRLKDDLKKKGIDPKSIDDPVAVLPGQPGLTAEQGHNDMYEPGLRYCMDTNPNPKEWRRKGYEACYESKALGLKSICLACARQCHKGTNMTLKIRSRNSHDVCDCSRTEYCVCSLSDIRRAFDNIADRDGCIGPFQLRKILQYLRGPAPIEEAEVEECLMTLGSTSEETAIYPRITPIVFERWYKRFYNIFDDDDDIMEEQGKQTGGHA